MMPLLPRLPFHDDETVASWVARLAALHTGDNVGAFLTDLGLDFARVVRRECEVVDRLAAVGGEDPERLRRNAVERLPHARRRVRGEILRQAPHCRPGGFVCARCLVEDAGHDRRGRRIRLRDRLLWRFAVVTVCPTHGVPLVDLGAGDPPCRLRLPTMVAAARWPEVETLAACAQACAEPLLQRYVRGRLDGAAGPPWLDGQELGEAITACELLGFVLTGRRDGPTRDGADEAGGLGFAVAAGGETAIREALREFHERSVAGLRQTPTRRLFGRLCQWAQLRTNQTQPLARLLREHIVETMPVGGRRPLFGLPIAERRVHSVASLSAQTGLNVQRLRGVLIQNGLVEPDDPRSDGSVAFDAAAGEALAQTLMDALSVRDAAALLGVTWVCAEGLVHAGVLAPAAAPGRGARVRRYAIARSQVEELLARFLNGAEPVEAPSAGYFSLKAAGKRTGRDVVALLAAVAEGRLRERQHVRGLPGVAGLRLQRAELDRVFPAPIGGDHLSSAEAARWLSVTDGALAALSSAPPDGGAPPIPRLHVRGVVAARAIARSMLETFDADYVSVRKRARELGVSARSLASLVRGLGVKPTFPLERSPIFRRDALDAAIARLGPKIAKAGARAMAAGRTPARRGKRADWEAAP